MALPPRRPPRWVPTSPQRSRATALSRREHYTFYAAGSRHFSRVSISDAAIAGLRRKSTCRALAGVFVRIVSDMLALCFNGNYVSMRWGAFGARLVRRCCSHVSGLSCHGLYCSCCMSCVHVRCADPLNMELWHARPSRSICVSLCVMSSNRGVRHPPFTVS